MMPGARARARTAHRIGKEGGGREGAVRAVGGVVGGMLCTFNEGLGWVGQMNERGRNKTCGVG